MGKISYEDIIGFRHFTKLAFGYWIIVTNFPEKSWKLSSVKAICTCPLQTGHELNLQAFDCESDALTTRPPSHTTCGCYTGTLHTAALTSVMVVVMMVMMMMMIDPQVSLVQSLQRPTSSLLHRLTAAGHRQPGVTFIDTQRVNRLHLAGRRQTFLHLPLCTPRRATATTASNAPL